jgi:hypothetical protein
MMEDAMTPPTAAPKPSLKASGEDTTTTSADADADAAADDDDDDATIMMC